MGAGEFISVCFVVDFTLKHIIILLEKSTDHVKQMQTLKKKKSFPCFVLVCLDFFFLMEMEGRKRTSFIFIEMKFLVYCSVG